VRLQRGGSNLPAGENNRHWSHGADLLAHLGERGDDRRRHIGLNGGFELFLRDIPDCHGCSILSVRHPGTVRDLPTSRNLVGTGEVFLGSTVTFGKLLQQLLAPPDCPRLNAIG
jgi:hypothetical protein